MQKLSHAVLFSPRMILCRRVVRPTAAAVSYKNRAASCVLCMPRLCTSSAASDGIPASHSSAATSSTASTEKHSENSPKQDISKPGTPSSKIQIAIVGSGPSGCFVATALTRQNPAIHVDIFERLPVPFGLCRYGVSPDHPDVKNVEKQFMTLFKSGRVTWMGNIQIGRDIPLKLLLEHYAGVVFATGADRSATLDVPGRDLAGVLSASDVVGNYNTVPFPHGAPRYTPIPFERTSRAVIIGNGNVAMDIARYLAVDYRYFAPTDMNCYTVRALMQNHIHSVDVIGRRGVPYSAFSTASFRELTQLQRDRLQIKVDPFDLEAAIAQLPTPSTNPRAHRRLMELVHQSCGTSDPSSAATTTTSLHSPDAANTMVVSPCLPALPPGLIEVPLQKQAQGESMEDNSASAVVGPDIEAAMALLQKSYADMSVHPTNEEAPAYTWDHPHATARPRGPCTVHFRYNLVVDRFLPQPSGGAKGGGRRNGLGGVLFRVTSATTTTTGCPRYALLPCDVAIQSIGYHSDVGSVVSDLPIDHSTGRILNTKGRVQGLPRVYCSGWAKNGSKGVIMHSLNDAQETARCVLADLKEAAIPTTATTDTPNVEEAVVRRKGVFTTMQGKYGLLDYFIAKQLEPVSIAGLERIFYVEKNRGVDLGKRLEKMDSVRDMLDVALGGEVGKKTNEQFRGITPARAQPLMYLKELLDDETDLSEFAHSLAKDMPHRLAANHPPGAISPSQL